MTRPVEWTPLPPAGAALGTVFPFAVSGDCSAADPVLTRASIAVREAAHEEEADVGMKYYGGTPHPEMFLRRYDSLRACGMGGMDHKVKCAPGELSFSVICGDDGRGEPRGRIVFRHIPSGKKRTPSCVR